MSFSLPKTIEILERTPAVLKSLLSHLNEDWTTANEGEDTWSAFDVVGHLIHGEKTDWIPRAKIILADSLDKSFEPFDRFAQFENSKGKTLAELLDEFETLREANIQKLTDLQLTETQLQLTGIHPEFGSVTLQHLLATWAVHDLGHLNQISRVMAKQYRDEVGSWVEYLTVLKK